MVREGNAEDREAILLLLREIASAAREVDYVDAGDDELIAMISEREIFVVDDEGEVIGVCRSNH